MPRSCRWHFPLPRPHTGMLLGNGVIGVMVWGRDDTLCVTLGRTDVWDHRGGSRWTEAMSYANIRHCLAEGRESELNDIFRSKPAHPGEPGRPSMLCLGRFEFVWPGATMLRGRLDLQRGLIDVRLDRDGQRHTLRLTLAMNQPVLMAQLPAALGDVEVRSVPAGESLAETMAKLSIPAPNKLDKPDRFGWTQSLPADPAYAAACGRHKDELVVTVVRGKTENDALRAADSLIAKAHRAGFDDVRDDAAAWWTAYWKQVPRLQLPNKRLRFLYEYGMFKFAGMTHPAGIPATLQGPWVEDYQLPPWSNDYHFNINVQMCYQPAYHGNCLHHLLPLFDMIVRWTNILRDNARKFVGVEDGRLLPHAVSDQCVFLTGYWGHSVDHGSTAWVAAMMYRYYRYTMDKAFLRQTAYPFMRGTMRVYERMLDRTGDGGYRLAIGVSPEYFTPDGRGFGPNASFQLAAIHRLIEDLLHAADVLGETPDPIWLDIQSKLPRVCLIGPEGKQRIALWEGQDLDESHRHHSHMAAITPFDVIDVDDPAWRGVIHRSMDHWLYRGPGQWSGWCVPWASMLQSHVGFGNAAELWLEIFDRVFTNEGHGTLHDADRPGFSLMGWQGNELTSRLQEVMQMDGGMGCVAAIQEMMIHTRRGVNYIFPGIPSKWRKAAFRRIRTDGAFLVSSRRSKGATRHVRVHSEAGGDFRVKNPFLGAVRVSASGAADQILDGDVLCIPTTPGQILRLTPVMS
ncbi:MAG: hypothetical protein IT440_11890 [Phycisphaeraceae bacterium]|nr:hypothetical protein [Phycisphaeraceae bacterium]